jgi:hypothetical protein
MIYAQEHVGVSGHGEAPEKGGSSTGAADYAQSEARQRYEEDIRKKEEEKKKADDAALKQQVQKSLPDQQTITRNQNALNDNFVSPKFTEDAKIKQIKGQIALIVDKSSNLSGQNEFNDLGYVADIVVDDADKPEGWSIWGGRVLTTNGAHEEIMAAVKPPMLQSIGRIREEVTKTPAVTIEGLIRNGPGAYEEQLKTLDAFGKRFPHYFTVEEIRDGQEMQKFNIARAERKQLVEKSIGSTSKGRVEAISESIPLTEVQMKYLRSISGLPALPEDIAEVTRAALHNIEMTAQKPLDEQVRLLKPALDLFRVNGGSLTGSIGESITRDISDTSLVSLLHLEELKDILARIKVYNLEQLVSAPEEVTNIIPTVTNELADARSNFIKGIQADIEASNLRIEDLDKDITSDYTTRNVNIKEELKKLQDYEFVLDLALKGDHIKEEQVVELKKKITEKILVQEKMSILSDVYNAVQRGDGKALLSAIENAQKYIENNLDYRKQESFADRLAILRRERTMLADVVAAIDANEGSKLFEEASGKLDALKNRIEQMDVFLKQAAEKKPSVAVGAHGMPLVLDEQLKLYLMIPEDQLDALRGYSKSRKVSADIAGGSGLAKTQYKEALADIATVLESAAYRDGIIHATAVDGAFFYYCVRENMGVKLIPGKEASMTEKAQSARDLLAKIATPEQIVGINQIDIGREIEAFNGTVQASVKLALATMRQALVDSLTVVRLGINKFAWLAVVPVAATIFIVASPYVLPAIAAGVAVGAGLFMIGVASKIGPSKRVLEELNKRRGWNLKSGSIFAWAKDVVVELAAAAGKQAAAAAAKPITAAMSGLKDYSISVYKDLVGKAESVIQRNVDKLQEATKQFRQDYEKATSTLEKAKKDYVKLLGGNLPDTRVVTIEKALKDKRASLKGSANQTIQFEDKLEKAQGLLLEAARAVADSQLKYLKEIQKAQSELISESIGKLESEAENAREQAEKESFAGQPQEKRDAYAVQLYDQLNQNAQQQLLTLTALQEAIRKKAPSLKSALDQHAISGSAYIKDLSDVIDGRLELSLQGYVIGLGEVQKALETAPGA